MSIRNAVKQHYFAFFAFFVLLYGFLTFVFLPLWLGVTSAPIAGHNVRDFGYMPLPVGLSFLANHPSLFLFFGYGFSPSLAGLTVAFLGWGPQGIRDIFSRLRPWGKGASRASALRAYGTIIVAVTLMLSGMLGLHYLTGGSSATNPLLGVVFSGFLITFLAGLWLDPGGVLEEIFGYRGFLLPTLLNDGVGPLKASIMIGILWVIWHMAVPFSPLLVDTRKIIADPHFWTFQLPYFFGYMIVGCLGMSVVMTHFYIKTGSSLSGILIHSGINSTVISFGLSVHIGGPSFASQDSFIVAWLVAGIMAAAALLIITIYGRGLVSPEITETVSIEQNT